MGFSNYITSVIRTIVPVIVGSVAGFLLKHGIDIHGDELATVLIAACISGYYSLVRFIETKKPSFGWLLGVAKSPGAYVTATETAVVVKEDEKAIVVPDPAAPPAH